MAPAGENDPVEEEDEVEEEEGEEGEGEAAVESEEEESEDEESEDEEDDTGLTENQNRLLYLISLYSKPALRVLDKEEWIRKPALMVLLYEAVTTQALDYDYAPSSELVEGTRNYFNISQEGKSDIDFLREEALLNGLKLSSATYQPVTCYQISEKGLELLGKIGKSDKTPIHETVYAPGSRNLLSVKWTGSEYWLGDELSGYRRQSSVTVTEDVSYVSSAYVPQCLRQGGRPTLSNAHRAHESGLSDTNIRDELDEIITLNSVSLIISEYVPFGTNQLVYLNTNLGSAERVQGGLLTAVVDESSGDTQLSIDTGLTTVSILDYTLTNHVNFEADIHFPEAPGIVQVETFGCCLTATGSCFYGMQVEAIMDRIKDDMSLDHLSRLLVDVHIDSSQIVDSVLSPYQRSLMNLIYSNNAENRDKINLIIANEITPHLTAEEYMDKGEYENELKQVLGDTRAAFDISEHDTLVFGAHGLLIAGPNSRHHEPLLCAYLQFESMNLFTQNYFSRMFILVDDMRTVRKLIETYDRDPNRLGEIQLALANLSREIIQLDEILGFLRESVSESVVPAEPPEQAGRALYDRLQLGYLKEQLERRVDDLHKNINGGRLELNVLLEMSRAANAARDFKLQEDIAANGRKIDQVVSSQHRGLVSLEMVQIILVALLTFQILDRLVGKGLDLSGEAWIDTFKSSFGLKEPLVWLVFNVALWAAFGLVSIRMIKAKHFRSQGIVSLRMRRYSKINLDHLSAYVRTKLVQREVHSYDGGVRVAKIAWIEKFKKDWGGASPTIQLEYDEENQFMLHIDISYERRKANKNLAFNAEELYTRLMQELDTAQIFINPDSAAKTAEVEPFTKDDTPVPEKKAEQEPSKAA